MNKVFLDSDVLLDFLLNREQANYVATIIENSLQTNLQLFTSPVSITNIYYIVGRLENKNQANLKTNKLLQLVRVETLGQNVIDMASKSKFKDFDDAVQNFCATLAGHQFLVTRNTKDFKHSDLAIMTPKEYLATRN